MNFFIFLNFSFIQMFVCFFCHLFFLLVCFNNILHNYFSFWQFLIAGINNTWCNKTPFFIWCKRKLNRIENETAWRNWAVFLCVYEYVLCINGFGFEIFNKRLQMHPFVVISLIVSWNWTNYTVLYSCLGLSIHFVPWQLKSSCG